jgi:hypothetical protein
MNIKVVFLVLVAIAASACYSHVITDSTKLDPSLRLARTCPLGVKIYTAPDRVQQSYREVALLNAAGEVNHSTEATMFASMREKAAAVGANGIILGRIDEPNPITKVAADVAKTEVVRKGRAMAIYVAADSASSAAACAGYKRPSKFRRVVFGS